MFPSVQVQERLAIVQSRKADEDLLGLTQEDTLRHLTDTLRQVHTHSHYQTPQCGHDVNVD